MSLSKIDVAETLRRLAERRLDEAVQDGKFDNLPGAGKPIELEDLPAEENARLLWWALRILKNNDYIPDEIRWRKQIALLKLELSRCREEGRLRDLVAQINALVLRLNTMGTNAIRSSISGVDEAVELERMRGRVERPDRP